MKFGYIRVSTEEQNLFLQEDALADCDQVFIDKVSGSKASRPELDKLLGMLRPGDHVMVWRLDRLGRSLKHLIELVDEFHAQSVQFSSVTEGIDTSTPGGEFIFHVFGALAQLELNLIRERTNAGLTAARARGRVGGRQPVLSDKEAKQLALKVDANRDKSVTAICREFGISRATYYRNVFPHTTDGHKKAL